MHIFILHRFLDFGFISLGILVILGTIQAPGEGVGHVMHMTVMLF